LQHDFCFFVDDIPFRYIIYTLGGGFKYFLFSSLLGEMIQLDYYFSNGLKPPTSTHSLGPPESYDGFSKGPQIGRIPSTKPGILVGFGASLVYF